MGLRGFDHNKFKAYQDQFQPIVKTTNGKTDRWQSGAHTGTILFVGGNMLICRVIAKTKGGTGISIPLGQKVVLVKRYSRLPYGISGLLVIIYSLEVALQKCI